MYPPPPPPPPPSQFSPNPLNTDKETQSRIFKEEAAKTRNFLLGIAALYFVGNALPVMIQGSNGGNIALSLIVTVIFIGMGILAASQPNIAVIISAVVLGLMAILIILVMVVSMQNLGWTIILTWIIFFIAIFLEVRAFSSAKKAEQAKKLML